MTGLTHVSDQWLEEMHAKARESLRQSYQTFEDYQKRRLMLEAIRAEKGRRALERGNRNGTVKVAK